MLQLTTAAIFVLAEGILELLLLSSKTAVSRDIFKHNGVYLGGGSGGVGYLQSAMKSAIQLGVVGLYMVRLVLIGSMVRLE